MYVIGLDVGTSGVKSTLFNDAACAVGSAYREYDLICGGEGMYELNPGILLDKSLEALLQSTQAIDRKQVRAICVTSFGESFVCLDDGDNVLSNTMIYMDKRGTRECEEFTARFSESEIYARSGQYIDPMFGAYKLRWTVKNKPDILEKTKRLLFICDFITYMLGAGHCCDYSMAARSVMFDIHKKTWWEESVSYAGIDRSILPEPIPVGSVVGTLSKRIADFLGMDASVKLIVGGQDQIMALIGSGAGKSGDVANGMGTVDCFTGVMDGDLVDADILLRYNLPMVPFIEDNRYATYSFNMSGGCIVKWFRDHLAMDIAHLPEAYSILEKEAPLEPTRMLVIPYFAGGGTPYMNSTLPAVVAGLRLNTSRGELYRAFLEGETLEMKQGLVCLTEAGIEVNRIITVGGGSNSSLWMQIRADIFERELHIPKISEAGVLGSAMMCYVNLGMYDSVAQAQEDIVICERTFKPRKKNAAIYRESYERYRQLYGAMKGIYQ